MEVRFDPRGQTAEKSSNSCRINHDGEGWMMICQVHAIEYSVDHSSQSKPKYRFLARLNLRIFCLRGCIAFPDGEKDKFDRILP